MHLSVQAATSSKPDLLYDIIAEREHNYQDPNWLRLFSLDHNNLNAFFKRDFHALMDIPRGMNVDESCSWFLLPLDVAQKDTYSKSISGISFDILRSVHTCPRV